MKLKNPEDILNAFLSEEMRDAADLLSEETEPKKKSAPADDDDEEKEDKVFSDDDDDDAAGDNDDDEEVGDSDDDEEEDDKPKRKKKKGTGSMSDPMKADNYAGNELVQKNLGIVRNIAQRRMAGRTGIDQDDVYQHALVALVRAANRWTPTGGASFATFAARTINRELSNLNTRKLYKFQREVPTDISPDPTDGEGDDAPGVPADVFGDEGEGASAIGRQASKNDAVGILHNLIGELPPEDKDLVLAIMKGTPAVTYAAEHGMNKVTMSRKYAAIRATLRQKIADMGLSYSDFAAESLLEAMMMAEDFEEAPAPPAAGEKPTALGLEEEGAVILNMLFFLIKNASRVQVA